MKFSMRNRREGLRESRPNDPRLSPVPMRSACAPLEEAARGPCLLVGAYDTSFAIAGQPPKERLQNGLC